MENNRTITLRETLVPNPQRGRCICFRTVSSQPDQFIPSKWLLIVSFYSIPCDFFGDGRDDDVNSSNPGVEVLIPFCAGSDISTSSTLSSVGSSLFVVGGCEGYRPGDCEGYRPDEMFYRFDTTAPAGSWSAVRMLAPRTCPLTVVMDGKLYVFGGGPYAPLGTPRVNPDLMPLLLPPDLMLCLRKVNVSWTPMFFLERRMKAERGAVDWLVMTLVLGNVAVMGAVAALLHLLLPSRIAQSVLCQDMWQGTAKLYFVQGVGYLDIRLGTAVSSAEVGGMLAAVAAGLVNPSYSQVCRFARQSNNWFS